MKHPLSRMSAREGALAELVKNWLMIALTIAFMGIYAAALFGFIRPIQREGYERLVSHLEPIIFVLIGYYFGGLPGWRNERLLKEEITWQRQKADAAQHAKEQSQQIRESLEEKVKNARTTLASSAQTWAGGDKAGKPGVITALSGENALKQAVTTALNILSS